MSAIDYEAGTYISIHALCEEGDPPTSPFRLLRSLFLSTPSARRATVLHKKTMDYIDDFYPRPLRGGRRGAGA